MMPKPWATWSYEPAGPVYLSILMDDWKQPLAGPARVRTVSDRVAPDVVRLRLFADRISASRRPALIFGPEVDRSGGWDAAIALSEKVCASVYGAPLPDRASFPEDHPLFCGPLGMSVKIVSDRLAGHDLVVVIGAEAFRYYPYVPGDFLPAGTELLQITADPEVAAAGLLAPGHVYGAGRVAARAGRGAGAPRLVPRLARPRPPRSRAASGSRRGGWGYTRPHPADGAGPPRSGGERLHHRVLCAGPRGGRAARDGRGFPRGGRSSGQRSPARHARGQHHPPSRDEASPRQVVRAPHHRAALRNDRDQCVDRRRLSHPVRNLGSIARPHRGRYPERDRRRAQRAPARGRRADRRDRLVPAGTKVAVARRVGDLAQAAVVRRQRDRRYHRATARLLREPTATDCAPGRLRVRAARMTDHANRRHPDAAANGGGRVAPGTGRLVTACVGRAGRVVRRPVHPGGMGGRRLAQRRVGGGADRAVLAPLLPAGMRARTAACPCSAVQG